jgi:hypothetical protein
MKYYDVVIEARISKTIRVPADEVEDETEAEEYAHESFSVLNDGLPESYNQDTIRVEIVEEDED